MHDLISSHSEWFFPSSTLLFRWLQSLALSIYHFRFSASYVKLMALYPHISQAIFCKNNNKMPKFWRNRTELEKLPRIKLISLNFMRSPILMSDSIHRRRCAAHISCCNCSGFGTVIHIKATSLHYETQTMKIMIIKCTHRKVSCYGICAQSLRANADSIYSTFVCVCLCISSVCVYCTVSFPFSRNDFCSASVAPAFGCIFAIAFVYFTHFNLIANPVPPSIRSNYSIFYAFKKIVDSFVRLA